MSLEHSVLLKSFAFVSLTLALPLTFTRRHFPFALALQFCVMAFAAAVFHGVMPYGGTKLLACTALAGGFTYSFTRQLDEKNRAFRLGWILFLVPLLFSDVFLIVARQGWGLDEGLTLSAPYFRPPFNSDAQRNSAIVQALLRGEHSPYLPHSALRYQLFWHHFSALFAWAFPAEQAFAVASGCGLATSMVVGFLFLWLLFQLRPSLVFSPVLILCLFTHADLLGMVCSWVFYGQAGIEADWSYSPSFFRYFSLKLVLLTAPQHAAFLVPFLPYLYLRWRRPGTPRSIWLAMSCLASPVMAIFFIAPLEIWKNLTRPATRDFRRIGATLAGVAAGYFLFYRFPIWDLFLRPGGSAGTGPGAALGWWLFFLLPLAGGGAAALLLFGLPWKGKRLPEALGASLIGILLFNLLLSGVEIRRHFAIAVAVLFPLGIWMAFPRRRFPRRALAAIAVVCLGLHGYFLYSYTLKPSVVPNGIAWQDYFRMNEEIVQSFPHLPTVAATSYSLGLVKPIALQATSTFADGISAEVHGEVPETVRATLAKTDRTGEILPVAVSLGYEAVIWGPVEEIMWGKKGRERFLHSSRLLASKGQVSLYTLKDNFIPEDALTHANRLRDSGWYFEAEEIYQSILREDKNIAGAHFGLGWIAFHRNDFGLAEEEFSRAVELEPHNVGFRSALLDLNSRLPVTDGNQSPCSVTVGDR